MRSILYIAATLCGMSGSYNMVMQNAAEDLVPITDTVKGLIIESSLPRGGPYLDTTGKTYGYGIFWCRVKNTRSLPVDLAISFPTHFIPIIPETSVRVFLPPGNMTKDKEKHYDYGATGLRAFIDTGLHRPGSLQKRIGAGEEILFYIGALFYQPAPGAVRAALLLKEDLFFYRIYITGHADSAFIPCGKILFRD